MTQIPASPKKPTLPSLTVLLDTLKQEIMLQLNCVKIGIVQSFNSVLQEANILIAYQQVTSVSPLGVKTFAEFPVLLNVPVEFQGGGGFTLTMPVSKGDECLVLFNDRELDAWLINGTVSPPILDIAHDLRDAIAIVGIRNNTRALANFSTTSTQLRSDDGLTYVEVAGGGIVNVVAPTSINMTAPNINLNATGKVTMTTPETDISGIIAVENVNSVTNPFTVQGKITATADIIAGNISLQNHVHTGVTTGSGNTGAATG